MPPEEEEDGLTETERYLRGEIAAWRAVQQLAYRKGAVQIMIDGRTEHTLVLVDGRVYELPEDLDALVIANVDDAFES